MACNTPNCGQCYGCQSACNTCNVTGCQTCQTCNQCQTCDKCMSDCNAGGQASYNGKKISEIFGTFSFSLTPVKDAVQMGPFSGMFNKAIWDEIATWLSKRHKLPTGYGGETEGYTVTGANPNGGAVVNPSSIADVAPFSAAEFDRISGIVGGPTVSSGDLITAALFTTLVSNANAKTVDDGACKYCVTACDLTYNACKTCNKSQCATYCQSCNVSCNGCDSICNSGECCNRCMGSCESCNACNTSCNSGQSTST